MRVVETVGIPAMPGCGVEHARETRAAPEVYRAWTWRRMGEVSRSALAGPRPRAEGAVPGPRIDHRPVHLDGDGIDTLHAMREKRGRAMTELYSTRAPCMPCMCTCGTHGADAFRQQRRSLLDPAIEASSSHPPTGPTIQPSLHLPSASPFAIASSFETSVERVSLVSPQRA
jgi:hypothetical protein